MPFFSIIIPTYNRSLQLVETLYSLQKQTFQDWECIVVDDGSIDDTKRVVSELSEIDSRIKYIYQENAERCVARNNGIDHATGDFICFLDSDDQYQESHLATLFDFIQKKEEVISVFFTNYSIKQGDEFSTPKIPTLKENLIEYLIYNPIIPSRMCIHKSILNKYQFEKDIFNGEDLILWLRIAIEYPFFHCESNTVVYNLHEDNSVNIKNNGGALRMEGLKKFFDRYPSFKISISKNDRSFLLGDTHFTIMKHFLYKKNRIKAFKHLLLSILIQKRHNQLKHKIYILVQLLLNRKIEEYEY
jgi:glycosyltransferase involved in cell wall biosynthesis